MPSDVSRQYLSIREFTQQSGLSQSTIRRRVSEGSLTNFQPGGAGKKVLIPTDALMRSDAQSETVPAVNSAPMSPPETPAPCRRGPRPAWKGPR